MLHLNLRHLDIFLNLCATSSVTRTAEALNLTQPAISKAIAALENAVQLRLFDRRANRLHLTADGVRVRDEAERLLNQVAFFGEEVEALQKSRRGAVNILAIPTLAAGAIAEAVGDFSVSYPEINVRLGIGMSRHVSAMVARNQIDIGFIHGSTGLAEVEETFIADSFVSCLMEADHPLAGRAGITAFDLMGFPLITFDVDVPPSGQIREVFAKAGLRPNVRVELNATLLAAGAIRNGAVAFVDPFSVSPSDTLVLRPFRPQIPLPIFMLTHRNKALSRPVVAFCDTARHRIFRKLSTMR